IPSTDEGETIGTVRHERSFCHSQGPRKTTVPCQRLSAPSTKNSQRFSKSNLVFETCDAAGTKTADSIWLHRQGDNEWRRSQSILVSILASDVTFSPMSGCPEA